MSDNKRAFPSLSSSNWGQWADNMEAYLSTKELWEYVDGSSPKPVPADPAHPTTDEALSLADWKRKVAKASGEIWLAIEDSQKVHIKQEMGDPVAMWRKLDSVHLQKKPGARFNAYEALLSVRKREDESLSDLMGRADKAMQDIKALRPASFTIDDLDQELLSMSLIRALPAEYNSFVSSLLLLDSLDTNKLQAAFQNEESQRLSRQDASGPSPIAHFASTPSSCFFCGGTSHFEKDCHRKKKASDEAKRSNTMWRERGRGGRGRGGRQQAKEAKQEEGGNQAQVESAGQASVLSAAERPQWLKTRAATDWNPDTGASSHMTPHRHWFCCYSPHVVPVRLADGSIIWSAGIGSVGFQPNGVGMRSVVFHDVLHVPDLGSNLLSLFHLTRAKGYTISIDGSKVLFHHQSELLFTGTINEHNIGRLDGETVIPHSANVASTCPLDLTLWHRRCSHINFADLKHMHDKNLVTGMDLRSKTPPDPICESCIFGKQRRHNIPKTATRRTSTLALVHTDLKGPLPVQSVEGYRYWEPFVDDKSRYIAVSFLKKKSEALQAFKQYKAYAENKLGCKIQMQRDDKGGEFISREFEDFCANEGILRQHTEPGEPHQNGVAERVNQEIAAGATTLLVQAKLPPSFWPFAVATYVHTTNRTPTAALNGETPYFHWKGKKPDISYFRVFGCLAYVLVRKSQRKALEPHSRKCIFVGYPEGVKAWQFWEPNTKQFLISSHAIFDECYFPGNSTAAINLFSLPQDFAQMPTNVLNPQMVTHQGGEDNHDDLPYSKPLIQQQVPNDVLQPADHAPIDPPPQHHPRTNPPRAARFKGSLNESELMKQNVAPAPVI